MEVLHPALVRDGLLGISPNNSDLDGWLSKLPVLPLLLVSPEPARRNDGRDSKLICDRSSDYTQ